MDEKKINVHVAIDVSPTGGIVLRTGNDRVCVETEHRPSPSCREPHQDDLNEQDLRTYNERLRQKMAEKGIRFGDAVFVPKASMDRLPDKPETIAQLSPFGRFIHFLTHKSIAVRDAFEKSVITRENIPDYPWHHQHLAALNDWYVERKKRV